MATVDFTRRILGLISDPDFIKFIRILNEPTFFSIVGRTHFERWHSCFIGWLLDPNGSHLLSDYVLKRLLLLLLDDKCLKPKGDSLETLLEVLPTATFSNIQVAPNEFSNKEKTISGVGRFDVFLTGNMHCDRGDYSSINMLLELKIDSAVRSEQSNKYVDWLVDEHPQCLNIPIYLLPELLSSPGATVGDGRWFCLDYQLLHDKLFIPILGHPDLSPSVRVFIIQYIKNLHKRYNGVKMAITDEEKELALSLYKRYSDVFDSIFDALQEASAIEYDSRDARVSKGRQSGKIAVKIGGQIYVGKDVKTLFVKVLEYLVDSGKMSEISLPWGKGTKRYIISNEDPPVHPNGRNFFIPVQYGAYSMESHYARNRAIKVLDDLCNELGIEFEVVTA